MQERTFTVERVEPGALDAALRAALGPVMLGLSTREEPGKPVEVRVIFAGEPTIGEVAQAQALIAAHDPVLLSVDKGRIEADGQDEATVTVRAATPVTLLVAGVAVAVVLEEGAGEVGITADDPQTIGVRLKDGTNRCEQVLFIQAV